MKSDPCLICGGVKCSYLFASHGSRIVRCSGCGFLSRKASNSKRGPAFSTEDDSASKSSRAVSTWSESETEKEASVRYAQVLREAGLTKGAVAILAPFREHPLTSVLERAGYSVLIFDGFEELDRFAASDRSPQSQIDAVILIEALERVQDPAALLGLVWRLLKKDGLLINIGISLDTWSARFFGRNWTGWQPQNKRYFGTTTLQLLLEKSGFHSLRSMTDSRLYTLEHIRERAQAYPKTMLTSCLRLALPAIPWALRQARMRVDSSRVIVTAQKNARLHARKLSIIMPVFNERSSFETTFREVFDKTVSGIDEKEIIIVESNSTDGTRDAVRQCEGLAGVRVIYEDRPRGKGHAVRTGLKEATGEIILIQDADMEYDVEDYDELVEPILDYREAFVLGTRHSADWKMRTFSDNPNLAAVFNLGQLFFTALLNLLYSQRMSDPFTMYKVFRRECLYGLNFECNRFDFDFELVIKLLRKGYTPFEIPVNYESRSYSEGKKVTIFRDPLTWIRASFKYRFANPFVENYTPYLVQDAAKTETKLQHESELVEEISR